jgi:hypothetical protein
LAELVGCVRDRRLRIGPVLAIAAAIAALGSRFFLVISKYSVNVFYLDQWEYLVPFFRNKPSTAELFFWQNGPHREGIGLIADKFLYPLTHWNARVDAFVVGGTIFAAMLLALRLKYRLFGTVSYADLAIPAIFLTLQQSEAMVATPNPAYSGFPLLMIMLYCLVLLGRKRLLRYSLALALDFLLIYTGLGIFMGVVTIGVFLLECYWSWHHMTSAPFGQTLAGLVVAVASLASFFVRYTFWPAVDCFEFPHRHLLQYPRFTALMFSGFAVPRPLHASSATTVLGVGILLVLLGIFGWHVLRLGKDARGDAHMIGAVLLSYSLLFAANTAVGRVCLTMDAAFGSRYVTLLIPAFLAAHFYLLSKPWHGKQGFVLAVWALLLLPAAVRRPGELRLYSNGKRNWANCYLRTENIDYCDQITNFSVHTSFEGIGLRQKLDYLKQHKLNLFYEPNPK